MNTYCEVHRRKFVGQGCPWCRDDQPRAKPAVNTAPLVANADQRVANRHGKYSDLEKRRTYMRDYMRTKRATP